MKKTVSLYDGQVVLHFEEKARNRYVLDDGHSPVGVTTVLQKVIAKEALLTWPMWESLNYLKLNCPETAEGWQVTLNHIEEASKAYLTKSDKGKDVGTLVHKAVEHHLMGRKVAVPPEAEKAFRAYLRWEEANNPRLLASEQIVYSLKHDYAGTFDVLFEIDGTVVLGDFKTTNSSRVAPSGIYPEMFLQLGAYSLAYSEENPKKEQPQDLLIIRLAKDGHLNTLSASELGLTRRDCEDAWLQALKLYRFLIPLHKQIGELQ